MFWEEGAPLSIGPARVTSSAKAVVLRVLMAVIMFLTGTYVGVDWAAYFEGFTNHYSAGAGYARSILCAVMVFIIGDNNVTTTDSRLLCAAFALTLVGDNFLTLHKQTVPGTATFLLVHLIYIFRHAQGFRASLAPERRARTVRFLAVSAAVAYGMAGLLIWRFGPVLARTGQLPLDAVYLSVLATSMWMAWGTLSRGFYDRRNAWYIAAGMTFFFFCDVSVGLSAAMSDTNLGRILDNAVGFFYSPALVLLAFSGYRWVAPGAPTSER